MSPVPCAPAAAPESIRRGLGIAAAAWFEDPERPRLGTLILQRWNELLEAWCDAADMPLIIRKARDNRGHALRHESGRILVPSDNSPAHWALSLAYNDVCPSLDDVRAMWAEDKIPVAMVMKAIERPAAAYRCTRQTVEGPNAKGWKVAHIRDVGLGYNVRARAAPTARDTRPLRAVPVAGEHVSRAEGIRRGCRNAGIPRRLPRAGGGGKRRTGREA